MPTKSVQPETRLLLDLIDQAYDHRAWHGTNLRGSLRGLSPEQLIWRPAPGRHNIWEIMLHAAYWKYIVLRRLTDGAKGEFERSPSDWPEIPDRCDSAAWKRDIAVLTKYHKLLRQAVADFPVKKLFTIPEKSKITYVQFIHGIASHDLYHAGQIQLIKRLQKSK